MTSATSSTSDPFELLGNYYRSVSAVRSEQDLAKVSLPTGAMVQHVFEQASASCTNDPVSLNNTRIICQWTLAGLERIDKLRRGILTTLEPNHLPIEPKPLKRTADQAFADATFDAEELRITAHDLTHQGAFLGSYEDLIFVITTQGLRGLTYLDLSRNNLIKPLDLDKLPHLLPLLETLKLPPRLVTNLTLISFISLFRTLRVLDLAGSKELTERGIHAVAQLKELRKLSLAETNVNDAWISLLSELPHLVFLDLSQTEVTHAGLDGLEGLTQLKDLSLAGCKKIDRGCIGQLGSLPNLERLTLKDSGLNDDSAQLLQFARSLTCLSLYRTLMTGAGFAQLSTLVNLTDLNLAATPLAPTAFGPLEHMRKLTKLLLTCAPADDVSELLAHVCKLTLLEELVLNNCPVSDAQVDALTKALPRLKKIQIRSAAITDIGLSYFGRLQNLAELGISGGSFTGTGLFALTTQKLRSLTLYGADITDQGLQAIGQLRLLEKLHIIPSESTDTIIDWSPLTNLTALQELNLTRNEHPPIAIIVTLVNLQRLVLNECDLDDSDLDGIEALQRLRFLSLTTNSLTGAAFQRLARLNDLGQLDLSDNAIDTLAHHCTLPVRIVSLERCPLDGSTLRNLHLPAVNQVKISDAPLLTNSDVLALLKCSHLQILTIVNCSQINADVLPRFNKRNVKITLN